MKTTKFTKLTLAIGWIGVSFTFITILLRDKPLYLVAQAISIFSGFLWAIWMNGKLTIDVVLSLFLSVLAAIVKDEWLLYSSALCRSVSYQLILIRQLKK